MHGKPDRCGLWRICTVSRNIGRGADAAVRKHTEPPLAPSIVILVFRDDPVDLRVMLSAWRHARGRDHQAERGAGSRRRSATQRTALNLIYDRMPAVNRIQPSGCPRREADWLSRSLLWPADWLLSSTMHCAYCETELAVHS